MNLNSFLLVSFKQNMEGGRTGNNLRMMRRQNSKEHNVIYTEN